MKTAQTHLERTSLPTGIQYRAPWGGLLVGVSIGLTLAILFAVLTALYQLPARGWGRELRALSPLAVLLGCALFTIRGYALVGNELRVRRLFWSTRVSLHGLLDARIDPQAVNWSLRMFGNGGLFSVSGWFWSRQLGRYRMFATHFRRPVVLDWGYRRLVVTPGEAEDFVHQLSGRCATLEPARHHGAA